MGIILIILSELQVLQEWYQNQCPEQLIQEMSGHHSLAIRSYQHTSEKQKRKACKAIFSDSDMYQGSDEVYSLHFDYKHNHYY